MDSTRKEELRKKYGITPINALTKSSTTQTETGTGRDFISRVKETGRDLKEGFLRVGEELNKGGEAIVDTAQNKDLNLFEKVVQSGSQAFRAGSRAFGEGILGIGKATVSQETEDKIAGKVGEVAQDVVSTPFAQDLISRYQSLDPEIRRNVDNILGFAEGLADIGTGGAVSRAVKPLVRTGLELAEEGVARTKSLFTDSKIFTNADDVVIEANKKLAQDLPPLKPDATPAEIRARAELEEPILTFKEKYTGLTPDVKKQIQGKPQQMAEYLDVVNARNLDVNTPTAYEYGGRKVKQVADELQTILDDTGGEIGQTRQKLGTYKANVDQVGVIENSFINELKKLNLQLVDGKVQQIPGTVKRVSSQGDLKAVNDLYEQLRVVKQSPTVTNLIDLRNNFDRSINFGKRAGEVSDSVDPLSRQIRKTIADVNETIVGKSEAGNIKKYSDYIEALNDLRSYTDRNAGGEYLLRLVLSGRGGEARKIIETVKAYTGKDLMDDAVLMTLVTDMLGNKAQKNLFAQEVTKAGVDAARILSGDPTAVLDRVVQFAKDKYIDTEKVLKQASQ